MSNDFPFRTHQEFVESINSGFSTIGIEYTAARGLVNTNKLKSRIILFNGMIWLPNVLILLSVVLSIYTSNWFLLLGIISAILGELFSNPYNPLKNVFIIIAIVSIAYLFIDKNILGSISWLCFTFAISFLSILFSNRIAWNWAYNDILKSEDIAQLLFSSGNLHIKFNDGQYFSNKK